MNRAGTDRRIALGVFAIATVALVTVVAVVGPDASPPAGSTIGPRLARAGGIGPERYIGPQGRVGQFVVACRYSHSGPHDPIVFPDQPGRSHRHDFYGAVDTDAWSRVADLLDRPTTCDKEADTAAYWHPTLYDGDRVVRPRAIVAYYRAAPGVVPTRVRPYPLGFALIAGDPTATAPPPGEAAGWTCGGASWLEDAPPACPPSAPLHLILTFADCWDGRHLDSVDHRSHAAYSVAGRCPASHPVHVPQLVVAVDTGLSGRGHSLRLASGSVFSAHGDFLNAWDPEGLAREIEVCIGRDVVCDLASNRSEEPLFAER